MFENEIRSRTIKMDNPIDQDGQPLVQKLQRERVGGALAVLQGPLLSIAASANTACCFSTSATHMGSHDAAKESISLLHPCTSSAGSLLHVSRVMGSLQVGRLTIFPLHASQMRWPFVHWEMLSRCTEWTTATPSAPPMDFVLSTGFTARARRANTARYHYDYLL